MLLQDLHLAASAYPQHPMHTQPHTPLFAAWRLTCTHILVVRVTHHLPLSLRQLDCLWDDWVAYRNPIVGMQIELPLKKET